MRKKSALLENRIVYNKSYINDFYIRFISLMLNVDKSNIKRLIGLESGVVCLNPKDIFIVVNISDLLDFVFSTVRIGVDDTYIKGLFVRLYSHIGKFDIYSKYYNFFSLYETCINVYVSDTYGYIISSLLVIKYLLKSDKFPAIVNIRDISCESDFYNLIEQSSSFERSHYEGI